MDYFTRLNEWYQLNWVRKDQLVRYVELGAITQAEYETITGEDFPTE